MENNDSIEEAKRYLENAKTMLKEKALKDGEYYQDGKISVIRNF